jgi:putative ABC transport system ATP-binding protein
VTNRAQTLVRATNVSKTYGTGRLGVSVLFEVSIEVAPGELCLLMGPSGSGKTTLVSILAGLLRPTSGEVELCGQRLSEQSESRVAQIRRGRLGLIFQQYNLFAGLTALDNVAEPLRIVRQMPIREARSQALHALDSVGLADRAHHLPQDLSGGEKQRVAIARATAPGPALVLGDEPTAALDWTTALRVMELLRASISSKNAALIVTHDHRLERFADRIIEMEDGRIRSDRRVKHEAVA